MEPAPIWLGDDGDLEDEGELEDLLGLGPLA